MRDFSMRQMRREYAGTLRTVRVLLLASFGAVMTLCWVVYIRKAAHTPADVGTFSLIPSAAFLALMGLYLVLTSPGRLIRRTPYGRSLMALGDPRRLMRQIDEEALHAECYPGAVPLKHWLILYCPERSRNGRSRVCARPVPAERIASVRLWRASDGIWMSVWGKDAEAGRVFIGGQEEARAVMQWLKAQEIKGQWIN